LYRARRHVSIDVLTFGCRLNAYESGVIRRNAERAGLTDLVVVNTCAVTAEAVRQARQAIRAQARARPNAGIVVTGCAAQTDPAAFAGMAEVARVIGNRDKLSAAAWGATHAALARHTPTAGEKIAVSDVMTTTDTAPPAIDSRDGRARA